MSDYIHDMERASGQALLSGLFQVLSAYVFHKTFQLSNLTIRLASLASYLLYAITKSFPILVLRFSSSNLADLSPD